MTTPWGLPDFDDHEAIHFIDNDACGLRAIIAVHSTHLGPAAGGARFWHYARDDDALVDALRLSRGMSYKNAMAGLPLGGGKAVILANEERSKSPDLLHAFGKAVGQLGGGYITAEDVGMSVADMIEVRRTTDFVAGLPNSPGDVGGDPGPHTSLGVFLGIKAAVKRALGKDSLSGLHIALQGAGSVATGVALHACAEGAKLSIADVDEDKAQTLAGRVNAAVVSPDEILGLEADVLKTMKRGSVLVDIAIDQGGCFETSHATTHADPVYEVDGVIHYCVANMPGAVARTSAFALNNATLPFALKIANMGVENALEADPYLAEGLNVSNGKIRHKAVAEALELEYDPV
jgi:leucine dehydrogenase